MGNIVMQRGGNATNKYVVLVGNIPWRCKWQDLKDLARKFTPAVERAEVYLTADGRSRGFGFVCIRGREEAIRVIQSLDGYEWRGRALLVKLGNEYDVCPTVSPPSMCTTPPAPPSPSISSDSTGEYWHLPWGAPYPYPIMCDPAAAMGCSRSSGEYYTPSPAPYLSHPTPPVSPPTPVPTPILTVAAIRERKTVVTEEAVLFVENLPSDVNGEELRGYFEEKGAGGIVRCDLPMGSSGKAKGYGTVVFGSASEAERAVIEVDGTVLRERRVRVRVNRFVGGGE